MTQYDTTATTAPVFTACDSTIDFFADAFTNALFTRQETLKALQLLQEQIFTEIISRPAPLMYKGWMTPEQYGKYLYLQLFKSKVKSIKAKGHNYIGDLKSFRRYQRR